MSYLLPVLLGLLGLLSEVFLREAFALETWTPDFYMVLVIFVGLSRTPIVGVLAAASLGLLADAFAASPLGLHLLQALVVFYAVQTLRKTARFRSLFGGVLLGAGGGLLALLTLAGFARLFLGDASLLHRLPSLLLPRVGVVLLFFPICLPLLERLDELLVKRVEATLL